MKCVANKKKSTKEIYETKPKINTASVIPLPKNIGGLTYPSRDVIKIVSFCEQVFRDIEQYNKKHLILSLTSKVLSSVYSNIVNEYLC